VKIPDLRQHDFLSLETYVPLSNTQSRITLYTGNTYFRHPQLPWSGSFRPFSEYATHLDILGIYTFVEESPWRVADLELIVQQPWKIASKQRSSTTREYIGAVQNIEALRQGRGEFETAEEFYAYWRKYKFKIGDVVQRQLDKLLSVRPGYPADTTDDV
jgi:Restriction endonuclease EcoRV